jgi:hypothetical protein
MATYRELTYMVLDKMKASSDDSFFTEEHILLLLDEYRPFILKSAYLISKQVSRSYQFQIVPDSNYQTICIDLEPFDYGGGDCFNDSYLRSVKPLPVIMDIGNKKLSTINPFRGFMSLVSNAKFQYAGGKFMDNYIFATISKEGYLYLKSCNPQMMHLERVKLSAVFENAAQASELSCNPENECDIMERVFPLEDGLIPNLISAIVTDLLPHEALKEDKVNNATDDGPDSNKGNGNTKTS